MHISRLRNVFAGVATSLMAIALLLGRPVSVQADSGTGGGGAVSAISPASQPSSYVGIPTEWRFVFTGETPYVHPVWSIVGGTLPEGLTLTYPASGATADRMVAKISGASTFHGSYPIVLRADPGYIGGQVDKAYTLVFNPMDVPPTAPPTARVGVSYGYSIPILGGTAPYVWSMDAGQLPQGLSLSSSGYISGTPTYASGTAFTVTARDSRGRTATRQLALNVDPDQVLSVSTASVPTGNVGQGYSTNLYAVGGTAAYRWSLDSGMLPTGLSFDAAGRISGTFASAGTFSFVVRVTDALNRTATKAFTMVVGGGVATGSGAASLRVSTSVLPDGVTGVWYGYNLGAEGGTAPYAWSLVSGTVPAGLSFEGGSVYGSPTGSGTSAFTVKVTDSRGVSATQVFSLVVHPPLVPGTGSGSGTGSIGSGSTGSGATGSTGSGTVSADTEARLRVLDRIGVSVNSLVKLPDDGNVSTQADSAVYFIGADGRRHAFPNANVFFTWYSNFNDVRIVSSADLASIPLGGNATYHPGLRMVKFTTDARVYVVVGARTLRPIASEAVARTLYGAEWNRKIDDIADTFYTDYRFGAEVAAVGDVNVSAVRDAVSSISDTL